MLYKVIEYIEFTQNSQIVKIAVFAIKTSEITKYSPRKRSLNRNFLNLFNRYGIFFMVLGESLCQDGLEFVWERGRGVDGRVTCGRS